MVVLFDRSAFARDNISQYRGFTIDWSDTSDAPNLDAVEASLKHQIDIAADCGAASQVIDFFKSQDINVKAGRSDGGGHFSPGVKGVSIGATVQEPQKPILLHEFLHAYHARVLPEGIRNPDVFRFYDRAVDGGFYPAGSYVLKNVMEFFAVTASLYLWGNVDRPPNTRAVLRARQPVYYRWLGDEFGVQKHA